MPIGIIPDNGLSLIDSQYAQGIAQGRNDTIAVITAFAGGGQAGAILVPVAAKLIQVTAATAADSIRLQFANPGHSKILFNVGANAVAMFANPNANRANAGAQDIINALANGTAFSIPAGKMALLVCVKAGQWAASALP